MMSGTRGPTTFEKVSAAAWTFSQRPLLAVGLTRLAAIAFPELGGAPETDGDELWGDGFEDCEEGLNQQAYTRTAVATNIRMIRKRFIIPPWGTRHACGNRQIDLMPAYHKTVANNFSVCKWAKVRNAGHTTPICTHPQSSLAPAFFLRSSRPSAFSICPMNS